jgi:hypothetical protein
MAPVFRPPTGPRPAPPGVRPAGGAYGTPRPPYEGPNTYGQSADYDPASAGGTDYDPANDYYSPPTGYDESTGYAAGGYQDGNYDDGNYEHGSYEDGSYAEDAVPGPESGIPSGKRRLDITATDLGYTGRRIKPGHAAAADDYGPEENTGYTGYGAPSPAAQPGDRW